MAKMKKRQSHISSLSRLKIQRSKIRGFASVLILGGIIVFALALMGLAIQFTNTLDTVYMDLALTLPKFNYTVTAEGESGNKTFDAFVQIRYIAAGIMAVAIFYAGVIRVFEIGESPTIQTGTSNRIISKSVMFLLFILIFPPLWDGGAEMMEGVSLWVLNPLYTFDKDKPCPAEWYDKPQLMFESYNASPYILERDKFKTIDHSSDTLNADIKKAEFVCEPALKVRYVFRQMLGTTEIQETDTRYNDHTDAFGQLTRDIQSFASEQFVNLFLGLTKALMTINVLLMSFIIGIMADALIGMLIAALPMFLMLSLVPKIDTTVNRFIDALPALFLLPILSSVVIVVGAGYLSTGGIVDNVMDSDDPSYATGLLYVWVTAIAIVFFAVSLPVMLVPLLGNITQMATQAVTSATQGAAVITGMAAAGGISGLKQGMKGPGSTKSLAGLGRVIASGGAGALSGLVQGHTQAAGAALGANITGGVNKAAQGIAQGVGVANNPLVNRISGVDKTADINNAIKDVATFAQKQEHKIVAKHGINVPYDTSVSHNKNHENLQKAIDKDTPAPSIQVPNPTPRHPQAVKAFQDWEKNTYGGQLKEAKVDTAKLDTLADKVVNKLDSSSRATKNDVISMLKDDMKHIK